MAVSAASSGFYDITLDDDFIDVSGTHSQTEDARCETETENEIPPRPTSRLGFNSSDDFEDDLDNDNDHPQLSRTAGGMFNWSLGLFTTNQSHPDNDGDADISGADDSDSDDEDSEFGSNLLLFPPPPRPSLEPLPPQTEVPQPMILDDALHPFSCLPSPLSPCYILETHPSRLRSPRLPRHNHRHHGRSHSALVHLKWFWSVREEDWQENQRPEAQEVDKLPRSTTMRQSLPSLANNNSSIKKHRKSKSTSRFSPLSIHPRRGDVSGLRDPYCAHIDRCFSDFPLWTMAKTLWMFDLQMGIERLARFKGAGSDDDSDSEGGSECNDGPGTRTRDTRSHSTSSGFSDDSDVTLVESDNDVDEEAEQDTTMEGSESDAFPEQESVGDIQEVPLNDSITTSPSASNKGRHSPECSPHKPSSSSCMKSSAPKSPSKASLASSKPQYTTRPPYSSSNFASVAKYLGTRSKAYKEGWDTDWYTRWELLMDIVRLVRGRSSRQSSPPRVGCSSSRRFFFAGEGEESEERIDGYAGCSKAVVNYAEEDRAAELPVPSKLYGPLADPIDL